MDESVVPGFFIQYNLRMVELVPPAPWRWLLGLRWSSITTSVGAAISEGEDGGLLRGDAKPY